MISNHRPVETGTFSGASFKNDIEFSFRPVLVIIGPTTDSLYDSKTPYVYQPFVINGTIDAVCCSKCAGGVSSFQDSIYKTTWLGNKLTMTKVSTGDTYFRSDSTYYYIAFG